MKTCDFLRDGQAVLNFLVVSLSHRYFLQLQTWILQVDLVLNSIGLVFVGVEFVLSVNSILQFYFDV